MNPFFRSLAFVLQITFCISAGAAITDFDQWTLVEDPGHQGFNGSASAESANFTVGNFDIPAGTDIGFQSVNGSSPDNSTSGFYFDPSSDFKLAIDFAWSFSNSPTGLLGLGFGIGEDGDGKNSAGVVIGSNNGNPFPSFGGAARTGDKDDETQFLVPSANSPTQGSMFVEFESATGNISLSASTVQGAASGSEIGTFMGIQKGWAGDKLMTSFFVRSDEQPLLFSNWMGGNANAVFSNFRVLNGSPVAIPEPTGMGFLSALGIFVTATGRRNRKLSRHCR